MNTDCFNENFSSRKVLKWYIHRVKVTGIQDVECKTGRKGDACQSHLFALLFVVI